MKVAVIAIMFCVAGISTSFTAATSKVSVKIPPFACPDVYDPVCTFDGRQFSNGCYAQLAGYSPDEYERCGWAIE